MRCLLSLTLVPASFVYSMFWKTCNRNRKKLFPVLTFSFLFKLYVYIEVGVGLWDTSKVAEYEVKRLLRLRIFARMHSILRESSHHMTSHE